MIPNLTLAWQGEIANKLREGIKRRGLEIPYSLLSAFANPSYGVPHCGEIGVSEGLIGILGLQGIVGFQALHVLVGAFGRVFAFYGTPTEGLDGSGLGPVGHDEHANRWSGVREFGVSGWWFVAGAAEAVADAIEATFGIIVRVSYNAH